MRYLVTARVKSGQERSLLRSIEERTLGAGSVAGMEYLRNMADARLCGDGLIKWIEVCFCDIPLEEERPFWAEFFDLVSVKDAHARKRCKDLNGREAWACVDCGCTKRLEQRLDETGKSFLKSLRRAVESAESAEGTATEK